MTEILKLKAELKEEAGTGSARATRNAGRIPAIIYGGEAKEVMISVAHNEFIKEYQKGGLSSKLVELTVDGKKITTIPKAVQTHPVSDDPIHIDFREISKGMTVKVQVHVRILNEDVCPGIKEGGVLNVVQRQIEVSCPPTSIPAHIDVDIAELEMNGNIHAENIAFPEGVEPTDTSNFTICSVAMPKVVEEEPEEVEGEEGAEGEAPAEGGEEAKAEGGEAEAAEEKSE